MGDWFIRPLGDAADRRLLGGGRDDGPTEPAGGYVCNRCGQPLMPCDRCGHPALCGDYLCELCQPFE